MSGYHFSSEELVTLDDIVGTLRRERDDAPWGDDILIMAPGEPPREGYVVEAMNDRGGMVEAYRPYDERFWQSDGSARRQLWSDVVGESLRLGWKLYLRKQGESDRD